MWTAATANDIDIDIKFRPLNGKNANGDRPEVRRVDLIVGAVTGTNTDEAEPLADGQENPWGDLWFYSNPVFVHIRLVATARPARALLPDQAGGALPSGRRTKDSCQQLFAPGQ